MAFLYKRARNNVTEMIKLSKKQYYENSIQESRHNPTKMWKVLKQLTHGNNRESPPNTLTADIINSYFTNIGLDTVSHLQLTPTTGVDCGTGVDRWGTGGGRVPPTFQLGGDHIGNVPPTFLLKKWKISCVLSPSNLHSLSACVIDTGVYT